MTSINNVSGGIFQVSGCCMLLRARKHLLVRSRYGRRPNPTPNPNRDPNPDPKGARNAAALLSICFELFRTAD